jgi:hypothetical protein
MSFSFKKENNAKGILEDEIINSFAEALKKKIKGYDAKTNRIIPNIFRFRQTMAVVDKRR